MESWLNRAREFLGRIGLAGWLCLAVSILGLALRLEHAITFDGPTKGSDYDANISGVYWMLENQRPFDFTPEVHWSVRYQPPFWSAVGAMLIHLTNSERSIAYGAVFGWVIRQFLLWRILKQVAPNSAYSRLAALAISAVLPISALTDGKVNPEPYHSTVFTVATYFLWRMERESLRPSGISIGTAALFGLFTGVSMLAKGTAVTLVMAAAIVLFSHLKRLERKGFWSAVKQRYALPIVTSATVCCLACGWWLGPNLQKYHHPFPHFWDTETTETRGTLAEPFFYRRPLGWALPFEWKDYVEQPLNRTESLKGNFWAVMVSGTFTDWYNRGFCRLPKERYEKRNVWCGWPMSDRCLALHQDLFWAGLLMTGFAVLSVVRTLRSHLKIGTHKGSLALPTIIALGVIFPGLFALGYPYDGQAVLNPRYLLPVSIPISACLGIALAQWRTAPWKRIAAHVMVLAVITWIGALVVYGRFGT